MSVLKNIVAHVQSHNKIIEQEAMWREKDLEEKTRKDCKISNLCSAFC